MNFKLLIAGAIAIACCGSAGAQSEQKSLSSTLDVYVFPTGGQAADQQNKDEGECYQWAVSNSGVDPFEAQKQAAAQQQQAQAAGQEISEAGKGAGVRGAAGGAAAGALIGEIADDDAGKGAAYGAAIGAVASRRRTRRAQQEATEQVEQQSAQAQQLTSEQVGNFKKAFSVCLEAKDYMVKY